MCTVEFKQYDKQLTVEFTFWLLILLQLNILRICMRDVTFFEPQSKIFLSEPIHLCFPTKNVIYTYMYLLYMCCCYWYCSATQVTGKASKPNYLNTKEVSLETVTMYLELMISVFSKQLVNLIFPKLSCEVVYQSRSVTITSVLIYLVLWFATDFKN